MRVSDLRALTNIERQMARRIRPKTADGAADWLEKKTGVKRPLEPDVDLWHDQPLILTDLLLPIFLQAISSGVSCVGTNAPRHLSLYV